MRLRDKPGVADQLLQAPHPLGLEAKPAQRHLGRLGLEFALSFFMTAGQVSDSTGAAALLDDLPKAKWLLGDRGYDADWFRDALEAKGIQPCIPGRRSRNEPVRYDKRRYRRRNRIEIMFGGLKDWRRIATCLIPRFDGAILSLEWKKAVWDKFVMGAPRPRTPSEQQYSDRKLRSRR